MILFCACLSALPSILCVPLMYVLARRLLGQTAGLLAAALMACAPFAVYYAQEARMYGLALMLFLLAFYAVARALDSGQPAGVANANGSIGPCRDHLSRRRRRGQAPAGGMVAGLCGSGGAGSLYPLLRLPVLGAPVHLCCVGHSCAVARWPEGHGAPQRCSASALARRRCDYYTPWLPVLFRFVRENYAASPYGQDWRANMTPSLALRMVTLMLGGYGAPQVVRWGLRLLFVLGILFMLRRRPLPAIFSVVATVLPFGLIIAVNPGHFITDRYFIFLLPVFVLGLAEGLLGLAGLAQALLARMLAGRRAAPPRAVSAAPLAVAFLLIPLLAAPGLERYFGKPTKPEWRELAQYVAETIPPSDLIVMGAFPHWDREPFDYYVQPEGRRVAYASQDPDLRRILESEKAAPWWIVYAATDQALGRDMRQRLPGGFSVVPYRHLAVVRRDSGSGNAVDDARTILTVLDEHIPGPYQPEVMRVIRGLASADGDMGKPLPPPLPTGK